MPAAAVLAGLIGAYLLYAAGGGAMTILAKGAIAFVPAMVADVALARAMRILRTSSAWDALR